MNDKRKKAEASIIKYMNDIDDTGFNGNFYKEHFSKMSDTAFDQFMKDIRDGSKQLVVFVKHFKSKGMTSEKILDVAKKNKIPMFEKLEFTENPDVPDFTTPMEYLLLDLPVRRQSQHWVKKISVPDDNKVIDYSTYQPTGDSKGSSLSYPEMSVLRGMNLHNSIEELARFRGGDKGGWLAYNASAEQTGEISLGAISPYTTGVESTNLIKMYLLGMQYTLEI